MPLRHDMPRAVLLMLSACAIFTLMSVWVKQLSETIPFPEQMFFRSALAMPVVMLVALRSRPGTGVIDVFRTRRFPGHLLRAVTGTLGMGSAFYALTILPLAEQTALTNTTPIFATLLAIPFLGEKVGIHRAAAVGLGFLGILVIAIGQGAFLGTPTPAAQWGLVTAVLHGVFSACTTLLVRSLSASERTTTIVMWQSLLMTVITGLTLPFLWVTPTWEELMLLVAIGLLGGLAQVMLTEAWASAEVSALAPYSYSSLLWAILFGWIAFGDVPGLATLIGAVLIVAASLYILQHELKRDRRRR